MDIKLSNKYLEHVATMVWEKENLKKKCLEKKNMMGVHSYRILLLLIAGEYTQVQLSEILGLKKQTITTYVQELSELNLIEVSRTEGRNKFFKAVTDVKKLNIVLPGQMKMQ